MATAIWRHSASKLNRSTCTPFTMKQKAFGVQSFGIASDCQPLKHCKNESFLSSRGLGNATADQQRVTLPYSRRAFHSSLMVPENNSIPAYHFDTFKFVKRLEEEGFTLEQSEAIMSSLREVIDESMLNLSKVMVTKAEQEKTVYTYKVDFASLKSEIQLLEKNDFSMMKAENERLQGEIEKLRQKLREEITRTQANVRLDLNLEKGRIRDEASAQEIKIKETDTRIESEIAGLRTQMEAIKFQILQYMVGTITGAGALILAYLRMFR